MSKDKVTSHGAVQDDTDLTTLVGPKGKYKALVEKKFTSEYGNLQWQDAKASTLEDFVQRHSHGEPAAVKDLLNGWIAHYGLKNRFQQWQKTSGATTEDNILGDGVYDKLTSAVCFFREEDGDSNNKPIGTGFAVSSTVVCSVAHNFVDPTVDKEVTCHFGKPIEQITRRLRIASYDTRLDYCILSTIKGEADLPEFLEVSLEPLTPGRQCILAAFQIGIQQDLEHLDPSLSVGVFRGEIAKLYSRHFVYQCPSFAGDSGGAVVLKDGKVIGIHQETVIQARERIQHAGDLDADACLDSVEASLDDLIRSLSSGSIGLQLSAIMLPSHLSASFRTD